MYQKKYLKYKNKYLSLKTQTGAATKLLPFPSTNDNEEFICSICREFIEEELRDPAVTGCKNNHYVHTACITENCRINRTNCICPICRSDIFYPPVIIPPDIRSLNRTNLLQIFQNLPNLQIINFDFKQIENIDPQTFQNLPNLETLSLSFNRIQNINPQTFQNLPNLKTLYLSYNQIQNIDPQTFQNLPNLKSIYLGNNPIQNINILRNQYPNIIFIT